MALGILHTLNLVVVNARVRCVENVIDLIKINLTGKAILLIVSVNPFADIRLACRNNL
jgi:hypothetical protein